MTAMGMVIGASVEGIVRALEPYGVDGLALARRAGVPQAVLDDRSQRFESDILDRFVLLAAEASGDPSFGLVVARHHALIGQAVHFAMVASDTLAVAWRRLEKYARYVSDHVALQTTQVDDFRITFSVPEPTRGTWLPCDVMAGSLVRGARGMSHDRTLAPTGVALRRPRPSDPTPFSEFFRAPLRFGADRNELSFSLAVATRPLPLANNHMALQADNMMQAFLARLDESSWADRVRGILAKSLPDGLPKRDEVARRLGVSDRALGRKLAEEGMGFRRLGEEVRLELACGYLENNTVSVTEIAFLLGFSDSSAFSRAFKRWKGLAPRTYAARTDWPNRSPS